MEKKYINESRYKKSSIKKRRDVNAIRKKSTENVKITSVKSSTKKIGKTKNRKKASVRREIRIKRQNVFTCIVLVILIAVIARAILKEEDEPFIPIYFGVEENNQVISLGIITTDDLLDSNVNNAILKELGYYSNYMLLTINKDYTLNYDVLESIDKLSNKDYILNIKKSRHYDALTIKAVLEQYISDKNSPYYNSLKEIESITVIEDSIRIILKYDNPYFVYNLDIPIIKTESKQYVITEESTSSCVVYERTKKASKSAPQNIIVRRYKDMYEGVEAYKKQEINMLITNQKNVQNILGKYEYNIHTYRNGETIFLFLNQKSDWLDNEEIRKVVAYSIDRDDIVKDITQSCANVIDLPYIYDTVKYKYDIYAAENLLLSHGYKKINKVYSKNNKQISLTLIVNKADEEKINIAKAIKTNLNSIGIKLNVEKLSIEDMDKRLKRGTYDLVLTSVNLNNKPNINFLSSCLYKTQEVESTFDYINETDTTDMSETIKNISNIMSNNISCIGILAKINYVISSKDIASLKDVSYLNVFSSMIVEE